MKNNPQDLEYNYFDVISFTLFSTVLILNICNNINLNLYYFYLLHIIRN